MATGASGKSTYCKVNAENLLVSLQSPRVMRKNLQLSMDEIPAVCNYYKWIYSVFYHRPGDCFTSIKINWRKRVRPWIKR